MSLIRMKGESQKLQMFHAFEVFAVWWIRPSFGHAVNWWIKLAPDVLAKLKGIAM